MSATGEDNPVAPIPLDELATTTFTKFPKHHVKEKLIGYLFYDPNATKKELLNFLLAPVVFKHIALFCRFKKQHSTKDINVRALPYLRKLADPQQSALTLPLVENCIEEDDNEAGYAYLLWHFRTELQNCKNGGDPVPVAERDDFQKEFEDDVLLSQIPVDVSPGHFQLPVGLDEATFESYGENSLETCNRLHIFLYSLWVWLAYKDKSEAFFKNHGNAHKTTFGAQLPRWRCKDDKVLAVRGQTALAKMRADEQSEQEEGLRNTNIRFFAQIDSDQVDEIHNHVQELNATRPRKPRLKRVKDDRTADVDQSALVAVLHPRNFADMGSWRDFLRHRYDMAYHQVEIGSIMMRQHFSDGRSVTTYIFGEYADYDWCEMETLLEEEGLKNVVFELSIECGTPPGWESDAGWTGLTEFTSFDSDGDVRVPRHNDSNADSNPRDRDDEVHDSISATIETIHIPPGSPVPPPSSIQFVAKDSGAPMPVPLEQAVSLVPQDPYIAFLTSLQHTNSPSLDLPEPSDLYYKVRTKRVKTSYGDSIRAKDSAR